MAKITRNLNLPTLSLVELLRKRKMTLEKFINEFGLASYESLKIRCERMGVSHPSEEVYSKARTLGLVNSPPDGILIMDPPKFIKENSGEELRELEVEVVPVEEPVKAPIQTEEKFYKKHKQNKFSFENKIAETETELT